MGDIYKTGRTMHSSLSETMQLVGDHIVIDFATEFEGKDLNTL